MPRNDLNLATLERRAIERALVMTHGRVQAAAKLLGVARATLYRRIESFRDAPSRKLTSPASRIADAEAALADAAVELGYRRAQAVLDRVWAQAKSVGDGSE